MSAAPILVIDDVSRRYGPAQALSEVSLIVEQGEFVALVGPSGCGKTTLLKLIAGFDEPTTGRLSIAGRPMAGVPAARRPTSMVFQKLALFPHMTVGENIAFPLKLRGAGVAGQAAQVAQMMQLMQLKPEYLDRYPRQLSGGEQQRVALARSMISEPALLLLDEPLSALDVQLKKVLQAELKRLHRQLGVTFIHVTHDLEEAMMLADRICILRAGRVVQVGRPQDIYYRPADAFVAGFIGDTNLFEVTITGGDPTGLWLTAPDLGTGLLPLSQASLAVKPGPALLMVRPELVRMVDDGIPARIDEVYTRGATIQYRARLASGAPVLFETQGAMRPAAEIGEVVALAWDAPDAYLLPPS